MDWLRGLTLVALLAVGITTGGAAVRLAVAAGDRGAAVALVLVGLILLVAVIVGARTRRWRRNPYW